MPARTSTSRARRQDSPVQPVPDHAPEATPEQAPDQTPFRRTPAFAPVWEEPAGGTGSRTASDKYSEHIAAMKANPGRWLVLLELTDVTSGTKGTENVGYRLGKAVSKGSLGFAPAGAFESTARKLDGARMKVWARYVGEQASTEASTEDTAG